MKIGVLTYHSCLNYGANLQLYANVKTLEQMGHQVFVYDNFDQETGPCRDFVVNRTVLTQPCRTDEEFRQETVRLGIEVILVGSDAVLWFLPGKKEGHGAYPNPFWLEWARDLPVRKALIAASCMGVMFPKIHGALRKQLKDSLRNFDFISVRDRWTCNFMRWLGISNFELVFDPTSCLPDLFQPSSAELPDGLEKEKFIMLCFSDPDTSTKWVTELTKKASAAGLKTCFVPHPDRSVEMPAADVQFTETLDPFAWLTLLSCSAVYAGERFHPIVLSAFFGVPFYACDYYSKSGLQSIFSGRSKTKDFCSRIGRKGRLIPQDRFFTKLDPKDVVLTAQHTNKESHAAKYGSYTQLLGRAVGEA